MVSVVRLLQIITIITSILVLTCSCQKQGNKTTFTGSPGSKIPIDFRTKPEPEIKGLVKWTCNGEILRFAPDDGGPFWDFMCDNNEPIPRSFKGPVNWSETTLFIFGTLLIPKNQAPGVVNGTITGHIQSAHIISSRWDPTRMTDTYAVADQEIMERLTITVVASQTSNESK